MPQPRSLVTDAFAHATAGLSIADTDGRILHVNTALADMLGWPDREELIGRRWEDVMVDEASVDAHLVERLLAGRIASYEHKGRFRGADGGVRSVVMSIALIRDAAGAPSGFLNFVQTTDDRAQVSEMLRGLADVDGLTGIHNRRRFDYDLERAIAHSRRHGSSLALILIDVDGLKPVNDTLGHLAGDDLLCAIARTLTDRLRRTDVLARIGGDEFAVLVTDVSGDGARNVAEDLVRAVRERPITTDGGDVRATITAGVAWHTSEGEADARALLRAADRVLYEAKAAGGDRAHADLP